MKVSLPSRRAKHRASRSLAQAGPRADAGGVFELATIVLLLGRADGKINGLAIFHTHSGLAATTETEFTRDPSSPAVENMGGRNPGCPLFLAIG